MLPFLQYLLPQHLISTAAGKLAESTKPWIKRTMIHQFLKRFPVNMREAALEDPDAYFSFNDFFTRTLKPGLRPITDKPGSIASPADGVIAQIGRVQGQQLLQAKSMYFSLNSLFAGHPLAEQFANGAFATFYLAPQHYHRVHMPLTGKLRQSIYVPGRLFSVNRMTADLIPNLYARNERLLLIFDTEAGLMAVILVGALIVGSLQTAWMHEPIRSSHILIDMPTTPIELAKGAELGHFKMGSTVILLFAQDRVTWSNQLTLNDTSLMGQLLGEIEHPH